MLAPAHARETLLMSPVLVFIVHHLLIAIWMIMAISILVFVAASSSVSEAADRRERFLDLIADNPSGGTLKSQLSYAFAYQNEREARIKRPIRPIKNAKARQESLRRSVAAREARIG
jgi:hypothetical protein